MILISLEAGGTMRCNYLNEAIPDISQKVLSVTLKRLEEDKLIIRKAYAKVPPRVECSLTKMRRDISPAVQLMIRWAHENFEEIVNK